MRIMFVGVGALGSYFGGALAEAGHDVTLLILLPGLRLLWRRWRAARVGTAGN